MDVSSFLKNFKKERQAASAAGVGAKVDGLRLESAEELAENIVFSSASDADEEDAEEANGQPGRAPLSTRVGLQRYKEHTKRNQEFAPLKVLLANAEAPDPARAAAAPGMRAASSATSLLYLHAAAMGGAPSRKRARTTSTGAAEVLRAELLKEHEKLNRHRANALADATAAKEEQARAEQTTTELRSSLISVEELLASALPDSSPLGVLEGLPPRSDASEQQALPPPRLAQSQEAPVPAHEAVMAPPAVHSEKLEEQKPVAAEAVPVKRKESLFARAKRMVAEGGSTEATAEALDTRKF